MAGNRLLLLRLFDGAVACFPTHNANRRFPRVSPLGHCIFQSRVPGLPLFAVVFVREWECDKTAPMYAQRGTTSGHVRFHRQDSRGLFRSLSPRSADRYRFLSAAFFSLPRGRFPRESANAVISGVSVESENAAVRAARGGPWPPSVSEVASSVASSPSLSAIYRQTGCFSTGRIFSCATISSAVQ